MDIVINRGIPLLSSLSKDCGFIKPHSGLEGSHFDLSLFPLTHHVILSLRVGNTWQTLVWLLTIDRQVKSQFQMRSETRVRRKKERAEAKRRYGRKEGKHLNSSALYPPLSKLPRFVPPICVFHLTSPPPHSTTSPPHSPSPAYRAFQRGCELIVSQSSSPDSLLQGWTLGIRKNSDHNH